MKSVVVIGGGFSGMSVAWELRKRGHAVSLIERSSRLGGLIETLKTPAGLVEKAAPAFNRTRAVDQLFKEWDVAPLLPPQSSAKRYIFDQNLSRWPLSWSESLKLGMGYFQAKLRGTLAPERGESVESWALSRLGSGGAKLVGTGLQGIYAGDPLKMSASLTVGFLFDPQRDRYKGLVSAQGGMGAVIEKGEEALRKAGVSIQLGTECSLEDLRGPVVLALPPPATAAWLEKSHPELGRRLRQIQMLPLLSVTAFFERPLEKIGFGCLTTKDSGSRALGVIFRHHLFPNQDPAFAETWILGGAREPQLIQAEDEKIGQVITEERARLFGRKDVPTSFFVTRWPQALPHYDLLLEDLLHDLKAPRDVVFHGNWLGGIGLSRLLERSRHIAERSF